MQVLNNSEKDTPTTLTEEFFEIFKEFKQLPEIPAEPSLSFDKVPRVFARFDTPIKEKPIFACPRICSRCLPVIQNLPDLPYVSCGGVSSYSANSRLLPDIPEEANVQLNTRETLQRHEQTFSSRNPPFVDFGLTNNRFHDTIEKIIPKIVANNQSSPQTQEMIYEPLRHREFDAKFPKALFSNYSRSYQRENTSNPTSGYPSSSGYSKNPYLSYYQRETNYRTNLPKNHMWLDLTQLPEIKDSIQETRASSISGNYHIPFLSEFKQWDPKAQPIREIKPLESYDSKNQPFLLEQEKDVLKDDKKYVNLVDNKRSHSPVNKVEEFWIKDHNESSHYYTRKASFNSTPKNKHLPPYIKTENFIIKSNKETLPPPHTRKENLILPKTTKKESSSPYNNKVSFKKGEKESFPFYNKKEDDAQRDRGEGSHDRKEESMIKEKKEKRESTSSHHSKKDQKSGSIQSQKGKSFTEKGSLSVYSKKEIPVSYDPKPAPHFVSEKEGFISKDHQTIVPLEDKRERTRNLAKEFRSVYKDKHHTKHEDILLNLPERPQKVSNHESFSEAINNLPDVSNTTSKIDAWISELAVEVAREQEENESYEITTYFLHKH